MKINWLMLAAYYDWLPAQRKPRGAVVFVAGPD